MQLKVNKGFTDHKVPDGHNSQSWEISSFNVFTLIMWYKLFPFIVIRHSNYVYVHKRFQLAHHVFQDLLKPGEKTETYDSDLIYLFYHLQKL